MGSCYQFYRQQCKYYPYLTYYCISYCCFSLYCRNKNVTFYGVEVTDANPVLKVHAVFTSLLELYPAEIAQNENQLVRLHGNHFLCSPYKTESQKLVIKLPSSNVESFTKRSPHAIRGSNLHFGPYKDVAPFEVRRSLISWFVIYSYSILCLFF
jgi:hypothetical protein